MATEAALLTDQPTSQARVDSEVGTLRRVLVHRPGMELSRLTPDNRHDLLFDELPWCERAQEEHDALVAVLNAAGVEVLYLRDLLVDVLRMPGVRAELVGAAVQPARLGTAVATVRAVLDELPADRLADVLIGGLTLAEAPVSGSLLAAVGGPSEFAIPPLPNQMFARDSSAWIGARAHLGTMARECRVREVVHLRAVYRHHPRFGGQQPPYLDPAALEGGDILVVGRGRVVVGVGPRTSIAAVERLVTELGAADLTAEVLVAVLPRARSTIHLDTVLTMLDRDAFTCYPAVTQSMPVFRVRPRLGAVRIDPEPDLRTGLARLLGTDRLRLVATGGDELGLRREQWDDANNVLALAPGVVVAYDRNVATNERLAAAGIEVLTVPGSELGRGRGGPRCLSCPLDRAGA